MSDKDAIIKRFDEKVRGKRPDTTSSNQSHDGKDGHWLETQMGIPPNSSNSPDLFGYEMKNNTSSKTSFGDWSASYYIYRNRDYGIKRSDFLRIFGKPNPLKNGRNSWSGEPCPHIGKINRFGQYLMIDDEKNIHAKYCYSKDMRPDKATLVPEAMRIEDLTIARWDVSKLKKNLEKKFNQMGWFKCLCDSNGVYNAIVFGAPMNYETWIELVRSGDVFFDSGMFDGNSRPYSQWRATNAFWNKLVISKH